MMFDLDIAISGWKNKLRGQDGFEDGDIEELEDHLRSKIEDLVSSGLTPEEAFRQTIKSDYADIANINHIYLEERKMNQNYFTLLSNFVKVGFRSIHKHSQYSLINIFGLAVGFACVFGIVIYLNQELSFDKFNKNGANIYRTNLDMTRASGDIHYPIIPPAFGPEMKANFPEIKAVARLRYAYSTIMQSDQNSFFEDRVFFAEQPFLEMFSFPLVLGNPELALTRPNTVVVTERIAEKYFGTESPLGKIINYNNEIDLEVTGVLKNIPNNTHLEFDFLISFETYQPGVGSLATMTSWRWLGFLTYVHLNPETDLNDLTQKATELYLANSPSRVNRTLNVEFQPLYDIYLGSGDISNPQGGLFRTNDPDNLKSLAIIAGLIIVIAFFNYFNILTALMFTRTKEFGVRKILGSSKMRIVKQMLVETCIVVILSSLLSLLTIWIFSGANYLPSLTISAVTWVFILMLALCTSFGLINGLYLGSRLASHGILSLLQNKLAGNTSKFSFKKLILSFQYGISAGLVMVSLIVVNQLQFFSQKDLGYDKEGILVAGFRGDDSDAIERRERLTNEIASNPNVKTISFGPSFDGSSSGSPLRPVEASEAESIQTDYFGVDYNFAEVINLEMLQGRFFDKGVASDSVNALLINETLAENLGCADPLNQRVIFAGGEEYKIIGVFKDFNYESLHHETGPMALQMWLGPPRSVLFKFNSTENENEAIRSIATNWEAAFPEGNFPFRYQMLEGQLDDLYSKEADFALLLKIFTALAIFVAILGIYGFSSVNAHLRIKQICIRRVLGAELAQISKLVGRDFLLISLISAVIASPIVYYIMNDWLSGFAYRIDISFGFFLIGIFIVTAVTVITLSIQVRKVMNQQPARILRSE